MRATLVSAEGCHLCERARDVLTTLGGDDLELTEVDWDSAEGQALVTAEGVPFPPAVFIDGRYVAYGRVSEGAIRKRLVGAR